MIVGLLACSAFAQIGPPGGTGPEFRIDFDARWKDIHWNGGFRPPSKHHAGTPYAEFAMSCVTVSKPETWTITGYTWQGIEIDIIQWEIEHPGEPYPAVAAGLLLVSAPGEGQTINGRAYMTGQYTTGCTVHYYDSASQQYGSFPVTTTKQVYVLGGPLEFSVVKPTQSDHPTPPVRDAQFSGPRYLQYFGYDPALLFQTGFPLEVQRAQTGHVRVKYGQPGDVPHVDWTLVGPLKFVGPHAVSPGDYTEIDVGATAASAPGAATVDAKIWVTIDIDGSLESVSSEIDPLEWPQKELEEENWYEDDDLFRFTSHKPDTMAAVIVPPATHADPWILGYYTNDPYGLASTQYFEVYDTNNSPMPSLWVQERFSFSDPPYHWGDAHGPSPFEEPGYIYSDYASGYGTGFKTNWATGNYWTTSPPPAENAPKSAWRGIFGPDNLIITIHVGWPYQTGVNPPTFNPPFFDFMHHYFAATRNAHPNGTTGLHIGTYRLRMWTDKVLHEKQ
jgi:hypothetical protein